MFFQGAAETRADAAEARAAAAEASAGAAESLAQAQSARADRAEVEQVRVKGTRFVALLHVQRGMPSLVC